MKTLYACVGKVYMSWW